MANRAILFLLVVGAATACGQSPDTEETSQSGQAPVEQAAQTETGPACWLRGEAAEVAQRPSAFDSVTADVGGQTIKLCYSRPKAGGRVVMGQLVPYDRPWRLGANEATTIHMPSAGAIAGVPVEAGTYSLYATPAEKEWRIHVNRNAQRWGIPLDANVSGNDVGVGGVMPEATDEPVEVLTARFIDPTAEGAMLLFEWERTRLPIPIVLR